MPVFSSEDIYIADHKMDSPIGASGTNGHHLTTNGHHLTTNGNGSSARSHAAYQECTPLASQEHVPGQQGLQKGKYSGIGSTLEIQGIYGSGGGVEGQATASLAGEHSNDEDEDGSAGV